MTESTAVASFRRVTPGMIASARLAMANDIPDVTKSEIALLLKKAAPVLGIDGTTYHVMDILLGLSRADDWKGAGRPVVAISNAKLAEYTMRSERTVIRCIRRLVEAGIAAYRDSSTGRRFVYRNSDGDVVTGFGIDFTPARVRADELREVVAQYQRRLQADLEAKRDIARLSRAIEDMCRACPSETRNVRSELAGILRKEKDTLTRANEVRTLYEHVATIVSAATRTIELSCEGDISVTSYINTTPESLNVSNKKRTRSNELDLNQTNERKALEEAYEIKPDKIPTGKQTARTKEKGMDSIQTNVLGVVSLGLLHAACPEVQAMTDLSFDSWGALGRSGEIMRRMVGLSEAGWADGKEKVGIYAAAAILATVVEKSIRDPEQISKPGGYFRAMIERALEGKLNLERSLFGLADHRYGKIEK